MGAEGCAMPGVGVSRGAVCCAGTGVTVGPPALPVPRQRPQEPKRGMPRGAETVRTGRDRSALFHTLFRSIIFLRFSPDLDLHCT